MSCLIVAIKGRLKVLKVVNGLDSRVVRAAHWKAKGRWFDSLVKAHFFHFEFFASHCLQLGEDHTNEIKNDIHPK